MCVCVFACVTVGTVCECVTVCVSLSVCMCVLHVCVSHVCVSHVCVLHVCVCVWGRGGGCLLCGGGCLATRFIKNWHYFLLSLGLFHI